MSSKTSTISGHAIRLKRSYQPVESGDGLRVLVDRLWSRGISKQEAHLDAWMKELGPSNELREWFGHRPERWAGFQERYRQELAAPLRQLFLSLLQSAAHVSTVTLVYGARNTHQNEAVVLHDYLLTHAVHGPTPGDNTLVVLATVAAEAAAQPSGEASASRLTPFVGALLTAPQVEAALQTLRDQGELQERQAGWRLSPRGKRVLQEVSSVPAKPQ